MKAIKICVLSLIIAASAACAQRKDDGPGSAPPACGNGLCESGETATHAQEDTPRGVRRSPGCSPP